MKKVMHINLGSYPFTIDIDAYEMLDEYFVSLEKHFAKSSNPDEIIFDIESRMAELFVENAGEDAILTRNDIEEAITIMGKPEDFGDEEESEFTETTEKDTKSKRRQKQSNYRTGRKLFRDVDNKIVSGVCSGLSAYFGISDPIWLRIFTAFMAFFTGGFVIIVYFVLAAIMPKAMTSADRKAMYGEPIDIDVVAESVEEEINALSEQLQDWTQSFRNKRKQKRYRRKRKY
jgi:phage shock protein PspC (stress-responsive transcriptional regulator)